MFLNCKKEERFPRTYRELSEISSDAVKVSGYIFFQEVDSEI